MSITPKTAMVFAAGLGKRMRPLTENMPKPLVPVLGKPLIDYAIDKLVTAGVEKAVVNTHYLSHMLKSHLQNRSDIEIIISHEEKLLETGGGLKNALPHLGNSPFFVINSDIIWEDSGKPALNRLSEMWDDSRMEALLLLQPKETAVGYSGNGDFDIGDNNIIIKPDTPTKPYIFSGVQIFNPKLLEGITEEAFSLSKIFFNSAQKDASLKGIYGLVHNGGWYHVGDVAGLRTAEQKLSETSKTFARN